MPTLHYQRVLTGIVLFSLVACGNATPAGTSPAAPNTTTADIASSTTLTPESSADSDQRFPDILAAKLKSTGSDTFDLDVTVASPYDTVERYADGWRVLDPDQQMLGEHMLTHDHATEQPFTRTQAGLKIPATVTNITIEGRDKSNGYGGKTVTIPVPRP